MTNQLEFHVTEFMRAINERLDIVQRLDERTNQIPRWGGFHDHGRYVQDIREAVREIEPDLMGMYTRMAKHGTAVLERSDEAEITERVSNLLDSAAEEVTELNDMFEKLGNAGNLAGFMVFVVARLATESGRQQRLQQMKQATVDLTAYCLLRFPPSGDGETRAAG
jgi:hypothetical protein